MVLKTARSLALMAAAFSIALYGPDVVRDAVDQYRDGIVTRTVVVLDRAGMICRPGPDV